MKSKAQLKSALFLATFLSTAPALATDFSQPILDLKDQPVLVQGAPLTLGIVAANALLADEKGLTGTQKIERFELAKKIYSGGSLELSEEERVRIKELVEKNYPPLVYARVIELLETNPTQEKTQ